MSRGDQSGPRTPRDPRLPVWVTALVWLSLLALIFYFWDAFSLVFLLLLATAAIAALLRPLRNVLSRHHPNLAGLAVGLAFWLFIAGLLALLGVLMYDPVSEQIRQWPATERNINELLQEWAARLGLDTDITLSGVLFDVGEWLAGAGEPDTDFLGAIADRIGVAAVTLVLLVFGSAFLLMTPPRMITDPVAAALPDEYGRAAHAALGDINTGLGWWLGGIIISMVTVGTLAGFGFWITGLEFWLPLAMLVGLSEIVPILGPTFAFIVVLLFAATQGMPEVIGVAIVWAIIQIFEPYVLVPFVMRQAVRIPPVVTIFTVVLWARIFGPLGLLLAVPINITIWAFLSNFVIKRRERERKNKSPPT